MNTPAMTRRLTGLAIVPALTCGLSLAAEPAVPDVSDGYEWGNVPIGGGGYFINVLPHPTRPGVLYVNSDMTGPFIRQTPDEPFRNSAYYNRSMVVGDSPIKSVSCIAIHPDRPDTVFVSVRGGPGLMRSQDAGKTFSTVHEPSSFTKHSGPEIAIDPANPDVIYRGSDDKGIYRSFKGGDPGTWEKVIVSDKAKETATHLVVIPPGSPVADGRSQLMYVGIPDMGVHISRDGGKTFSLITEQVQQPQTPSESKTVTLLQEKLEADGNSNVKGWTLVDTWMRDAVQLKSDAQRHWLDAGAKGKFAQKNLELPPDVVEVTLSLDARTQGLQTGEKPHETISASLEFILADGTRARAPWFKALFLQPAQTEWTPLSTTVEVPQNAVKVGVRIGSQAKAGAGSFSNIVVTGKTGAPRTLPMNPTEIQQMAAGPDGTLYVSGEDLRSYRPERGWLNLTPPPPLRGKIGVIGVHPKKQGHLLAFSGSMPGNIYPLIRSRDDGKTWEGPFYARKERSSKMSYGGLPGWSFFWPGAAPSALTFDVHRDSRAWISDAYMVWQCEDVWADNIEWIAQWRGLEDTVPISLAVSPRPDGKKTELIAAFADTRGLRWEDPRQLPVPEHRLAEGMPERGSDMCSFATSENHPGRWYGAMNRGWTGPSLLIRSDDSGFTWRQMTNPMPEEANHGGAKIAVSATNPDVLIYSPGRKMAARVSHDGGETWKQVQGMDGLNASHRNFSFDEYIAADTVDGNTFYAYREFDGAFLISRDGGLNWSKTSGHLPKRTGTEGQNRYPIQLAAKPGVAGAILVSLSNDGVFRSTDFGETFEQWKQFTGGIACGISYGAPAPGSDVPGIYVANFLDKSEHRQIYRSTDDGKSWEKIGDSLIETSHALSFAASRQVFGRVFFGTNGRGVFMGEPRKQ